MSGLKSCTLTPLSSSAFTCLNYHLSLSLTAFSFSLDHQFPCCTKDAEAGECAQRFISRIHCWWHTSTLIDKVILRRKKTKAKAEKGREKRTGKRKMQRGGEKLPGGQPVRADVGSQASLILWTVSPVMMKEEDFSPHPKCFTETYSNSLWTATAYDGVSTNQSTPIRCKHCTSTDF